MAYPKFQKDIYSFHARAGNAFAIIFIAALSTSFKLSSCNYENIWIIGYQTLQPKLSPKREISLLLLNYTCLLSNFRFNDNAVALDLGGTALLEKIRLRHFHSWVACWRQLAVFALLPGHHKSRSSKSVRVIFHSVWLLLAVSGLPKLSVVFMRQLAWSTNACCEHQLSRCGFGCNERMTQPLVTCRPVISTRRAKLWLCSSCGGFRTVFAWR